MSASVAWQKPIAIYLKLNMGCMIGIYAKLVVKISGHGWQNLAAIAKKKS